MNFLISGTHVAPLWLVGVGFIVGVLGGFFGVGGSFLAAPALFFLGIPMNFVVGTDLAHIVGKSIVAVGNHRRLGHVDYKLGAFMLLGTLPGVEAGARFIEHLKHTARIDQVVGGSFIVLLLSISAFMAWEAWATLRMKGKKPAAEGEKQSGRRRDHSAFSHIAVVVRRLRLPPYVDLPTSGIRQVSVWAIIAVSLIGGFFSGFLGGGAGYIRMPSMIYLLGIPTHIAVGTDLFEIILSAGYGTFSHAVKGNVDILIALVMHTGAAFGAQIGSVLTQYFSGARIRLAFIPLPLIGAGLLVYSLVTGHKF